MKRQSFVLSTGAALAGGALPAIASGSPRVSGVHQPRHQMPDEDESSRLLGSLFLSPYNFVPKNFAPCDGRILRLGENPALYTLLGNRFGGDLDHFALPNLTGQAPIKGLSYLIATRGIYPERKAPEERALGITPLLGQLTLVAISSRVMPPQGSAVRRPVAEDRWERRALRTARDDVRRRRDQDVRGSRSDKHEPTKGVRYVMALVGRFPFKDLTRTSIPSPTNSVTAHCARVVRIPSSTETP